MTQEKPERDLWWLFVHMVSFLGLQFGFDPREFWFGKQDPWDKNQTVKFRFLKMYSAGLLGCIVKMFFVIVFFMYRIMTGVEGIQDILLFFVLLLVLLLIITFVGILEDWYKYWKSTKD